MRRLLAVLTLVLGILPLAAQPASAAVAVHLENRASGSAAVADTLVGKNTRLSEDAVRENLTLRYDLASDSPVAAEGIAGAGSAANVANGVRLGEQLSLESANSAFTASGELSEGAIQNATQIFEPGTLSNPAIPEGFGKYTTETFASPSGPFQAHFYMNPSTGEVFYGLDYKAVFNTAFGP